MHRLRRLDPGLDRGEGLSTSHSSRRQPGVLHRHPGLRLGLLLAPPIAWLGVAYLAALAAMFVTSLW